MPRRLSALAFLILALSIVAPAMVVACGQGDDSCDSPTSELPQASPYSQYGRRPHYRDRRFARNPEYTNAMPAESGVMYPGMMSRQLPAEQFDGRLAAGYGGMMPPPDFSTGMPPGRFRGLGSDVYNGMGRASIIPRMSGKSGDDYLTAMISDEGIGRWAPDRFPLKIYFAPGRNVPGYRASFKAQMMDALNEWVSVSNGKLAWQEVPSPQQADIYCQWTAEVNRDRPHEAGFTVAMARNNDRTPIRTMGKAKVTILTHYNGKILTDRDMRKVCLHELGHAYGLQGHSPFSDDIMYATTSPYQGDRLSQRDVKSIQRLYSNYSAQSTVGSLDRSSSGFYNQPYMN